MRRQLIVSNVRIMRAVLGTALVALTVMQSLGVEPGEDKEEFGFVSLFDGKTLILTTYGNRDPSFHWDRKINEPLVRAFMDRIDEALQEFGDVRLRKVQSKKPLPYRGEGVRPDGRVTLAAYVNRAVLDSFTFSKDEWKTFAPTSEDVGGQWTLSESVMRRLSRILSPISDLGHHPPRPPRHHGHPFHRQVD